MCGLVGSGSGRPSSVGSPANTVPGARDRRTPPLVDPARVSWATASIWSRVHSAGRTGPEGRASSRNLVNRWSGLPWPCPRRPDRCPQRPPGLRKSRTHRRTFDQRWGPDPFNVLGTPGFDSSPCSAGSLGTSCSVQPKHRRRAAADSLSATWRHTTSSSTQATYPRRGCSQEGRMETTVPHPRHTNRWITTHTTLQSSSAKPMTPRRYTPCPTIRRCLPGWRQSSPHAGHTAGRRLSGVPRRTS